MHFMVRPLLLSMLLAACLAVPASAQQGPDVGNFYLSFDETLVVQELDLEPNDTFDFYLRVALDFGDIGDPSRNGVDGIVAWEACVQIPPEVTVLDRVITHVSFNGADDSCDENWQMALDGCLLAEDTPVTLIRYSCQLGGDATNLEITLDAASPSSIDGNRPGWFQCQLSGQPTDLHAFASGYEEPLVINGGVATDSATWSTLKITY